MSLEGTPLPSPTPQFVLCHSGPSCLRDNQEIANRDQDSSPNSITHIAVCVIHFIPLLDQTALDELIWPLRMDGGFRAILGLAMHLGMSLGSRTIPCPAGCDQVGLSAWMTASEEVWGHLTVGATCLES